MYYLTQANYVGASFCQRIIALKDQTIKYMCKYVVFIVYTFQKKKKKTLITSFTSNYKCAFGAQMLAILREIWSK